VTRKLLAAWVGVCLGACTALAAPSAGDAPKLIKDLKNKNPKVRAAAARDLGELGEVEVKPARPAIPLLLELLKKDKDPAVRRAAAEALGKIEPEEPKEVVDALVEALESKKETSAVRQGAANGLGDTARDALPVLRSVAEANREKDRPLAQAANRAARRIQGR
jgi:HEAT repeat protein